LPPAGGVGEGLKEKQTKQNERGLQRRGGKKEKEPDQV